MLDFARRGWHVFVAGLAVSAAFGAWVANVPSARALTYFSDSFDPSPQPGWTTSDNGAGTIWEWGTPTSGPLGCASPPNCYATNLASDYTDNADAILVTPSIDLMAVLIAWLHFDLWYETESFFDRLWVDISTNGGLTWSNLDSFDGFAGWQTLDYVLTPYVGNFVLVRFQLLTDGSVTYPGAYLDNVLVDDVAPTGNTMTFAPFSLAPLQAQQAQANVPMARVDASVDMNSARWESVTLTLSGTGTDSDISGAYLWYDTGDGVFNPGSDFVLTAGGFNLGTVTLNPSWTVFAGSPDRFFITYNIALAATPGVFVGVRIDAPDFTVDAPNVSQCLTCPFDTYQPGTRTEILAAQSDTMTILPSSMAPAQAEQAQVNVLMAQFDLSVDANDAMLEDVTIGLSGTGADADIALVIVWRDDGDGMFDAGTDTPTGGGTFFGGTVTVYLYETITSGTGARLFLTYDIDIGATVGAFVGASIGSLAAFTVSPPDLVTCPSCPIDTYVAGVRTQIVAATIDTVTMTPFDMAPNSVEQGNPLVLMGGVDLRVDANTASVSSLQIDRTGTGTDADISYLIAFLDDGDGMFSWSADQFIGIGFFGGGTAMLSFSPSLGLAAGAPRRVWIAYSISSGATIGSFVGMRVFDATYLSAAPDTVVCNGCPLDTYVPATRTEIIAPVADTLTIAPVDVSPTTVQQGDVDVPMLAVDLTVDANSATMQSLRIDLTGTGVDADVQSATLWADDGDNAFEPNDDLIGPTQTFFGGTTTFGVFVPITPGMPIRLWFSFDIDPAATVGAFLGMGILDATYATVSSPDSVVCAGCPFNSYSPGTKTQILGPTPDVMTFLPSDLAPTSTSPGGVDVPILGMALAVNANAATVSSVRVDLTGTVADADIAAVRLWRDDGDGVFEPSADTPLGTGAFSTGSVTFPVTVPVTSAAPARLFVSYDIAASATVGSFLGGLVDSTSITVLPPDTVTCVGCPRDTYVPGSKTRLVAPTLTFTPTSAAPPQVQVGDAAVIMGRILLAVDTGAATLTSFDVDLSGTGTDTDIAAVRVWLDDGDGAFNPSTDTLEDTATFTGGSATFTTSVLVAFASDEILWITYDIAAGATVGAFVGLRIADGTYATAAAPAAVVCSGCPLDTYQPGTRTEILAASADTLTVTPFDVAPSSVPAGATRVAMARIGIAASPGPVMLQSITATLSGTGAPADIASASVWLDDGDGSFNAGTDTLLVQLSSVGSFATNVPVSGGGSETLFLAYDIAAGATIGAYVGVSVTSSSFTVGPSDSASCAGCPFDTYVANTRTRIAPPTGTITGTVRDQDGGSMPGVAVELLSGTTVIATTTTNAAGAFTFSNVAAGSYLVRAFRTGYGTDSEAVSVTAGATATASLVLTAIRGSVTGRVRDAATGLFIAGARVELLDDAGTLVANTTTNTNGQFSFDDLDMGRYSLRISASGYTTATVPAFDLAFASPAKDVGNVDLNASAPAGAFPLELIAVLVILAIAVALGLLFLVRWRRKKAAGQTVPTPVEGIAQRPQEPPLPPASGGLPPPPPP